MLSDGLHEVAVEDPLNQQSHALSDGDCYQHCPQRPCCLAYIETPPYIVAFVPRFTITTDASQHDWIRMCARCRISNVIEPLPP
jgi:hypothetical protein